MKKRYIGIILAAMMTAQPLAAQGAVNPSPNTKPVVRHRQRIGMTVMRVQSRLIRLAAKAQELQEQRPEAEV